MNNHVVLNRPLLTPPFLVLGAFGVTAIVLLLVRFFSGMGTVTNLNGGYPWGIWVVYDIVVGTAFACGGYALAVTVYVFNKGAITRWCVRRCSPASSGTSSSSSGCWLISACHGICRCRSSTRSARFR